jgi:hypothetical protein
MADSTTIDKEGAPHELSATSPKGCDEEEDRTEYAQPLLFVLILLALCLSVFLVALVSPLLQVSIPIFLDFVDC